MGGFSEGFNILTGNGTVTNSGAAEGTLILGENNPGVFTYTGRIVDGVGKVGLWKAGTSNMIFDGSNSFSSAGSNSGAVNTLTMINVNNLAVGMVIQGTNIAPNTRITAINTTTRVITLSNATTAATNATFNVWSNSSTSTGPTALGATSITLQSVAGLTAGMQVQGLGIAAGTTILSFTGNAINLSAATYAATTAAAGSSYSFTPVNPYSYTGETLIGRAGLVLQGANGRLSGASPITVSTSGTLLLENKAVVAHGVVPITTSAVATNTTSINMSSVAGLVVGMTVSGTGIQANTSITAISGNTITLSRANSGTTNSGTSLSFRSRGEVSQDRIADTSLITLEKGGNLTLTRSTTLTANGGDVSEVLGTLRVQNGTSFVRTDHSDGSAVGNGILAATQTTLTFSGYDHQPGGVVVFGEIANGGTNVGLTSSKTVTTPDLMMSRIAFTTGSLAASLIGDSVVADVDAKVLIGAFGGTNNSAANRLVTVETFGGQNFVRLLDPTIAGDYDSTSLSGTTVTVSNLAGVGTNNRDNNLRISAGAAQLIDIEPSSNVMPGRLAFNAALSNITHTLRISEQNALHLGGFSGDVATVAATGSGMVLFDSAATWLGGTVDFATREAIIRTNNNSVIASEISGAGGLTKSGGAQLELRGWNSFTGQTFNTQGNLLVTTSSALGATGTGNGTQITNSNLTLNNGINVGGFDLAAGSVETLTLNNGSNLFVTDQANFWNGQLRVNSGFATGQGTTNNNIEVTNNAILVLNGAVSGISTALGGEAINPTYTSNLEGRQLVLTNTGTGANRNGIIRINGLNSAGRGLSDEDFTSALGNHQKLNLVIRGYTGQDSATNSDFNVIIEDSSSTNGFLDLRSGYVYLKNGFGSSDQNTVSFIVTGQAFLGDLALTVADTTGITVGMVLAGPGIDVGTTVAAISGNVITLSSALTDDVNVDTSISSSTGGQGVIIRQNDTGNVARPGTITAVLLGSPGASFRAPTLSYGENNANYSSKTVGVLGGTNNSGTITFGNGQNTYDLNPLSGAFSQGKTVPGATSTGANSLTLNNTNNLAVGQRITGAGIAPGTDITAITGALVTLSQPTTGNIAANGAVISGLGVSISNATGPVTAPRGSSTSTLNLPNGSNTLQLSNVTGLRPGMLITGAGIVAGTTIIAVDFGLNTVDISTPTNSATIIGNTYTIANPNGSQYLSVASTAGLSVGMGISGTGIQANTLIANIDTTHNVLTLSRALNANVAAANTYTHFTPTSSLTLSSVAGLEVGMGIGGTGIAAGVVITGIAGNVITLSAPTTATVDLNTLFTLPLPVLAANVLTAAVSGVSTLTLSSADGIPVGSTIQGTGIVNGTTITAVNYSTNVITLSQATSGAIGVNGTVNVRKLANFAETRLYQSEGGTSDYKIRFTDDGGFALTNAIGALTKVGLGTSILSGSAVGGASDLDGGINVMGGRLELTYGTLTNNSRVNGGNTTSPYQLTLAGGEMRFTNTAGVPAAFSREDFRGNFTLRPGSSTLTGAPTFGTTINVSLGLDNPLDASLNANRPFASPFNTVANPSFYWREPDRYAGAVLHLNYLNVDGRTRFFYSQNDIEPILSGTGQLGQDTVIPYATVKYSDVGSLKQVVDFAAFDPEGAAAGTAVPLLILGLTASSASDYIDLTPNVSNWNVVAAGPDGVFRGTIADETPASEKGNVGFSGTLANNFDGTYNKSATDYLGAKVIRFMADTASNLNTINLGGNRLVMGSGFVNNGSYEGYAATRDGGAILVSNLVGNDDQLISNGTLTSAYQSTTFSRATMVAPNDKRVIPYDSRDLILTNYNTQGLFRITATIADYVLSADIDNPNGTSDTVPGTLNLVVAGPGTTKLEAFNTYTGVTYVSGGLHPGNVDDSPNPLANTYQPGTLLISSELRLGPAPGSPRVDSIYLNGGRLEFAEDANRTGTSLGDVTLNSNRGIMLGGNGGYIQTTHAGTTLTYGGIVQAQANILATTTASQQMTENVGVGDLTKEGAGRLILTNSTAVGAAGWNAYYGKTEVRGGTLQLNISAANSGILGSGVTLIDSTRIGTGARLDLQITGGAGNGTNEWITLDGGTLGTTASHTDGVLNGVIQVDSASVIDVATASTTLRLNETAGYLAGTGSLTKNGEGTLILAENNGDFSGAWTINQGVVIGTSQGLPFGTGTTLNLGDTSSTGGTTAALYLRARVGFTTNYDVNQAITVRSELSGAQAHEIGVSNLDGIGMNDDRYRYNGALILNDDLAIAYRDLNTNAQFVPVVGTNAQGSQQAGISRYIALNGAISGAGNLSTVVNLTGTGANVVETTFELNGGSAAWTGNLTIGNAVDTNSQRHIVRLGSSTALTAVNDLTMNFNNVLQVAGNSITINDLTVAATGVAASTGAAFANSDIIIENAANTAATLKVVQDTNRTWDVLIQDGITPDVYSASSTPVHDAPLSLVKAGNAIATLTQTNTFTGTTTVSDGTLRSGVSNIIPDASGLFVTPATAADTATLDLNGFNDTVAFLTMGGATNAAPIVQTGAGTMTLNGNVTYIAAAPAPTGAAGSGSTSLTLASATGLPAVGTSITGAGIVAGTFITAVAGNVVTLSQPSSGPVSGAVALGLPATFGSNPAGGTISGNLALGAATRTFTVGNSTNAPIDLTVSALISGAGVGLIKEGAGTMVLSADNTYTGTTTVNAGVLQLAGAAGDTGNAGAGVTTIAALATLSGTGTVSGTAGSTAHVMNGILTPGDITVLGSRGTLTTQGNLTASASTSQLLFDLFAPTGTYGGLPTDLLVGSPGYAATLTSLATTFGTSQAGDLDHLNGLGSTLTFGSPTTITVNSVAGGTPFAVGQVFNLLDWATITPGGVDLGGNQRNGGLFGDLSLPSLSGALSWDTTKFFSDGMLVIVQVPEPSRTLLLLMSLLVIGMRRRRYLAV